MIDALKKGCDLTMASGSLEILGENKVISPERFLEEQTLELCVMSTKKRTFEGLKPVFYYGNRINVAAGFRSFGVSGCVQ